MTEMIKQLFDLAPKKNSKESDEAILERLEKLATAAEKEVIPKIAPLSEQTAEEHRRQVAGFKFDCRRHGDFLSLLVTRFGNSEVREFGTTINIGSTKTIDLKEGHSADLLGVVHYQHYACHDKQGNPCKLNGEEWFIEPLFDRTVYPPGDRPFFYHYEPPRASPGYPGSNSVTWIGGGGCCDGTSVVTVDDNSIIISHGWNSNSTPISRYKIKHETRGYPRYAEDDAIVFNGIDSTLYVPTGLGRDVLNRILHACEFRFKWRGLGCTN